MITGAPLYIFYQSKHIKNVIYSNLQVSKFCTASQFIAEIQADSLERRAIPLAVDRLGTAIAAPNKTGIVNNSFSCYGHIDQMHQRLSIFGFNGELPNCNGNYLLGSYRLFSPSLMRFMSFDSIAPFAKDNISGYGYCSCDPINHSDPTGHIKLNFLKSVRRLFKKNRPSVSNPGLSQSLPEIDLPAEYSRPEPFNPLASNSISEPVLSPLPIAKPKRPVSYNPKAGVPSLKDLARYEPSAPKPVNPLSPMTERYLKRLNHIAEFNYAVMSESNDRDFINEALRSGNRASTEATRVLFTPGYQPSLERKRRLLRD